MKQTRKVTYGRRLTALFAASAMAVTAQLSPAVPAAITAYGAVNSPDDTTYQPPEAPAPDIHKDLSPDFAYSAEKWASLRDNVMEYEELADLVHEYNPTVRSNRSAYNDLKGTSSNEISEQLMDDAQDIWDTADEMKSMADDLYGSLEGAGYAPAAVALAGNYGTVLVGAASLNFNGNSLEKMADNNFEDADMEKIKYDQTEANLVYQAQQLMATLEQSEANLSTLQGARDNAQKAYEAAQARQAVGAATQKDVLDAQKAVQDQDAAIRSAQKSADNVHRSLCLMLGWSADAQPEIAKVPEPDMERIASLNPDQDLEQAYANNYDIRYNEKKIQNLTSQDLIASTRASIDDAKNTVANSLKSQYNKILVARDTYNTAVMNNQLQQENVKQSEARRAVGMITDQAHASTVNAALSAEHEVQNARLQLRLAMETYDWIVNGLTVTG